MKALLFYLFWINFLIIKLDLVYSIIPYTGPFLLDVTELVIIFPHSSLYDAVNLWSKQGW